MTCLCSWMIFFCFFLLGCRGHWNDDRDCESAARLRISVTNPSLRSRCACDHLVGAREESYKLVQNPWLIGGCPKNAVP